MIGNLQGQPAGGGANKALSNLAAVAINTSLISDTDSTDDLGSSAIYWANAYIDTIYLGSLPSITGPSWIKLQRAATTNRVDITTSNATYYFKITTYSDEPRRTQLNSVGTAAYIESSNDFLPELDSTYDLGRSTVYWAETYTDKLFLNATATLDGATAGDVNVVGTLKFGTHTTIGAEITTGYITIKDSAGTSRKLAVVS